MKIITGKELKEKSRIGTIFQKVEPIVSVGPVCVKLGHSYIAPMHVVEIDLVYLLGCTREQIGAFEKCEGDLDFTPIAMDIDDDDRFLTADRFEAVEISSFIEAL